MKTSEPIEEPSNFEKYRNLRKLNSNRAQKLNFLSKSKYASDDSSNFSEFLNYLDLVPSPRALRTPVLVPHTHTTDKADVDSPDELKSKIDWLLAPQMRPKATPNTTGPIVHEQKILKCIFDYLRTIGGSHTPNDSFSHVQSYLKLTETKKCALVYGQFYCLVKIKKILPNLYSLNFLKTGDSWDAPSDNDLSSVQIYFSDGQCSHALLANLKKIDWCKSRNLTLKKPDIGAEVTDAVGLVTKLGLVAHDATFDLDSFFVTRSEDKLVEIVDSEGVHYGRVSHNTGGRCRIELLGSPRVLFYFASDVYLKSLGWSRRSGVACPDAALLTDKERKLLEAVEAGRADVIDQDLPVRTNHLLEVLHDNSFHIGRVTEVCNGELVRVRLDSARPDLDGRELSFLVDFKNKSKSSQLLYPCKWCERNNLALGEPSDWMPGQKFDWEMYTKNKSKQTQLHMSRHNAGFLSPRNASSSLADNFKIGQFLEAALDKSDQWLYPAKIKAVLANLLFVKVYARNLPSKNKLYIFTSDSCDLFPLGWSQINNYKFFDSSLFSCLPENGARPDQIEFHASFLQFVQSKIFGLNIFEIFVLVCLGEEEICGRVYLNSNVLNLGPYFGKAKLAELPLVYGPGPVFLVIFKLVQNLLSVCEKPFKLLKIIQKIGKKKTEMFSQASHRKVRLKAK